MGRKNKYWSKEDKLKIVKKNVEEGYSATQISKENNANTAMVCRWVKKYLENGETSLENKRKPGNPLMKYSSRKTLSPLEQLEYENMKLRIENER